VILGGLEGLVLGGEVADALLSIFLVEVDLEHRTSRFSKVFIVW